MKLSLHAPQRRLTPHLTLLRTQCRRSRHLAVCALAILLGLTATGSIAQASNTSPGSQHIYLYTTCGAATDVTATYSYHDNHLFDPDGIQVGTGSMNGQILDASGNVIGYISYQDPMKP